LCSVIKEEDTQTNEDVMEKLKSKFEDLTKQSILKYVAEDIRSREYEVLVTCENNSWFIHCPFCPQKKFKVVVERQTKCNITNIRNHFNFKHGRNNIEGDAIMDLADDLTQSNVAVTTLKSSEASGSLKANQKDDSSKITQASINSDQSSSEQSMQKKPSKKRTAHLESSSSNHSSESSLHVEKKSRENQVNFTLRKNPIFCIGFTFFCRSEWASQSKLKLRRKDLKLLTFSFYS